MAGVQFLVSPLPRKFKLETLQAIWSTVETTIYFFSVSLLFSLISLFSFSMRAVGCYQAAEGWRFIKGWSAEGWCLGVVPLPKFKNVCKSKDQNLWIYGSWMCFYLSTVFMKHIMRITYVRTSLGKRAFSVIAPRLWNSLPPDTRNSLSVSTLRSKLKTHLFKLAFPPWILSHPIIGLATRI